MSDFKSITDVMNLASKELLAIHAMLDRIGVPRLAEGEKMSVSQRVACVVAVAEHFGVYWELDPNDPVSLARAEANGGVQ